MYSTITATLTTGSPLVSRGLRYDPLRNFDGSLITDFEGNVLYSITATYRSVLSSDSFLTSTLSPDSFITTNL